MNGFAGIRIHDDGILVQPTLPPGWNNILLRGLHCRGVSFDLLIEDAGRTVSATNFSAPANFRIYNRAGEEIPRI